MKKLVNKVGVFLTAILFALPGKVFAAPPKLDEIGGVIGSAFDIILPLGALLTVGMVIYGGYMWMMSAGDPGKLKQAQGLLTWSVLGLAFLALTRMILTMIFDFLAS